MSTGERKTRRIEAAAAIVRASIDKALAEDKVAILPPMDVEQSLRLVTALGFRFKVTMLDPWYNKGFGGTREDYTDFVVRMLRASGVIAEHVYLWGFPEVIAPFVERIPQPLSLTCWLTWYYKNNPSVIRGWRSSQNACLHLSQPGARLYPEHFLNGKQLELRECGKLRYMPGPTSVIEEALLVGFVGRREQTGHPSQKPLAVYDKLYRMVTVPGDLVFDPMCGSGTTGAFAQSYGLGAIVSDIADEYTSITEKRLGLKRLRFDAALEAVVEAVDGASDVFNQLRIGRDGVDASSDTPRRARG